MAKLGVQSRHRGILQPVIQLFSKLFKIDWFREARSTTRLQNPFLFRHQSVCGHGNHGDLTRLRFLAHPGKEVEAAVFTEIDIKQDDIGKPFRKNLVTGIQVCRRPNFIAFHFEPIAEQLAVELIVFDDEDTMFQAFSKAGEVTTRSSCLINGSRHAFCFRKSDSACAWMYFSSSLVRSLLVSTNTERSAVRGLERHSASNSKPLILGRTKSRMTSSGRACATLARACAPSVAVLTAYPYPFSNSTIISSVGTSSSTTRMVLAGATPPRDRRQRSTAASNVALSTGLIKYSSAPRAVPTPG